MIGVAFNWGFDIITSYVESDNRLTIKERIIVTFIWPIALITFIYHLIKTFNNGPN